MAVVKVDTSKGNVFDNSYEPVPPGIYVVSLGNLPGSQVEASKVFAVQNSKKNTAIIPAQLRIEGGPSGEETSYKGRLVFDNFALSSEVGQKRLVHCALSFGAMSKEEISSNNGVDLERFSPEQRAKVEIKIKNEKPYDDPTGEPEPKNVVKRYLFE